jgi:ubiquinone/menaquinone biosynthesis C-methylase UbiE
MNKVVYSKFKEYVKSSIMGTQHEWDSHIDNMLRLFDKNLEEYIPNNMLDVGCGDGSRTMRIASYCNIDITRIYGVDYDEDLIKKCQDIFHAVKIDLEFESIPHHNDIFDLVICNQVLEHLKNYSKVIDELIRITKKKGYILIGIPNLAHLINRIYLLFGIQPMCIALDGPHVRAFTHRNFVKMLDSLQEIKLIDVEGSLMYPLPFFIAKTFARYFVGLSGYVCYLLQKI